ncbi:ribonuclease P protein component [Subtercola lobariae]|uniref:ribonuclease P protein component n=1 Tax=Subtercola lobariae TaxID=1588641 RepID=UPI0016686AC7|nr:ribonuclease P protein component [Subtercola lobariae]
MLAQNARVTTAEHYRAAVRRGARFVAPLSVTYVRRVEGAPARFGFIVSKQVGVAVVRNRVRRRLKAACFSLLPSVDSGVDVVIRALPSAASASFAEMSTEVSASLRKAGVLESVAPELSKAAVRS